MSLPHTFTVGHSAAKTTLVCSLAWIRLVVADYLFLLLLGHSAILFIRPPQHEACWSSRSWDKCKVLTQQGPIVAWVWTKVLSALTTELSHYPNPWCADSVWCPRYKTRRMVHALTQSASLSSHQPMVMTMLSYPVLVRLGETILWTLCPSSGLVLYDWALCCYCGPVILCIVISAHKYSVPIK